MVNYAEVAHNFVDGKVQNEIIRIFELLSQFVNKISPNIEMAYAEYKKFIEKKVLDLSKEDVDNFIRYDLEESNKALYWYNIVFNAINTRIASITSNFTLRQFLISNGVDNRDIKEIQSEVNKYWEQAYLPLFNKLKAISLYLKKLKETLELEIKLMAKLKDDKYDEGCDELLSINELFLQERKLFWDLVEQIKLTERELAPVFAMFQKEVLKIKEMLKAHLRLIKSQLNSDVKENPSIKQSERVLKIAFLTLNYIAGAALLYLNLKDMMIKKGILKIFGAINTFLVRSRIKKIEGFVEDKGADFVINVTQQNINSLLNVL
ncbi:hypothetical protein J4216_05940 [Candidatus Woesearchaeota archaeon]|nr:hypothetical protein [Candidatus Woesearchaeota archaeon]